MKILCLLVVMGLLAATKAAARAGATPPEEVRVFGDRNLTQTSFPGAARIIDKNDMAAINFVNVEDALQYQPNVIVRRRYIGDLNSTLGMRGSNMYQTARSMVFADGLPLHYFLQTRFAGAPRWSLVAPNEIQSIEVIYGPFSAEHSGNAMGGVVNIKTAMPEKQEVDLSLAVFDQHFSYLNTDQKHPGYQAFISYGDLFENFSIYGFFNRLENESQPMTFSSTNFEQGELGSTVGGAIEGHDIFGQEVLYYGDQGPEKIKTDLLKIKLQTEAKEWYSDFILAYENRQRSAENPSNYLADDNGDRVWRGEVNFESKSFFVSPEEFYLRDQERKTLLVGASIAVPTRPSGWLYSMNLSHFYIMQDQDLESSGNFSDPEYGGEAMLVDLGGSGWDTVDLKLTRKMWLFSSPVQVSVGYHFDRYELSIDSYRSTFPGGLRLERLDASGGITEIHAGFVQSKWQINDQLELDMGLRYERWRGRDNYPLGNDVSVKRKEKALSPKLSLAYRFPRQWLVRYSVAKAHRFPLVEELFQNERRTSGTSLANADLKPEDGVHHNVLLQGKGDAGDLSINYFQETVEDVIFNQTQITPRVTTFLSIDRVKVSGLELAFNQFRILGSALDLSANVSYVNAKIEKNSANIDAEGKQFPRMPKWRANLLLQNSINEDFDISLGYRYASDNFGRLTNTDTQDTVFGAHDSYAFWNVKAAYRFRGGVKLSLGIDNITNDLAFVFSPWPGRTVFGELSMSY